MAALNSIKNKDLSLWYARNERLNEHHTLAVGEWVRDQWGGWGQVIHIDEPENPTVEDHGGITVDQSAGHCRFRGMDQHEHYTWFGWKRILRRIDPPA